MLKVLSSILCDLDPKVKVIGQKAGICDGVPSTFALVWLYFGAKLVIFCIIHIGNRTPFPLILLHASVFSYFT